MNVEHDASAAPDRRVSNRPGRNLRMSDKPAKAAAKRTASSAPKRRRRKPSHAEISRRAYFIHLEQGGGDQVDHWLRAERELTPA